METHDAVADKRQVLEVGTKDEVKRDKVLQVRAMFSGANRVKGRVPAYVEGQLYKIISWFLWLIRRIRLALPALKEVVSGSPPFA